MLVRAWFGVWLALATSACSVHWVSAYDEKAVDRTARISEAALAVYQELLATAPEQRSAAMRGPLSTRHNEVETLIRVHLLREQARPKNDGSITAIRNLLAAWQSYSVSHRAPRDASGLSDATLDVERMTIERHLRSAFVAEEAKKLGGAQGDS